jgi:hypothetical protein
MGEAVFVQPSHCRSVIYPEDHHLPTKVLSLHHHSQHRHDELHDVDISLITTCGGEKQSLRLIPPELTK